MDVCIAMQDAELVGELLQALHILDTPHAHPAMQKGYHFLLGAEKQGKMRGNWVQTSASFYQKYHAAYTGIIGLAEFKFDPKSSVAFFTTCHSERMQWSSRPQRATLLIVVVY